MPLFYLTPLARIEFFDPKKNVKKMTKKLTKRKETLLLLLCISLQLLLRPRHICSQNLWPSVTKNIQIYSDGTEVAIWKNSLHFLSTSYVGLYERTLCNSLRLARRTCFLFAHPTCPSICSYWTWYKTCWCISFPLCIYYCKFCCI